MKILILGKIEQFLAASVEVTEISSHTVWKFHDLSITQILREINFGDGRSAKSAILTHF